MNAKDFIKQFYITPKDIENIKKIAKKIDPELDNILDEFYEIVLQNPAIAEYFPNDNFLKQIRQKQKVFWEELFKGHIDDTYIQNRKRVGRAHAQIGLPFEHYFLSVNVFNNLFDKAFVKVGLSEYELAISFQKFCNIDRTLIVDTYNELSRQKLQEQSKALTEMSTPVTQLWDDILLLPLVGIIDSGRAQNVMTAALSQISKTQSKVFILDISGVAVVDTAVANYLIKITKAAKLMGCICTISGISGAIAQTIVELGIQIDEVNTTGNMKDALADAFKTTGAQITTSATDD